MATVSIPLQANTINWCPANDTHRQIFSLCILVQLSPGYKRRRYFNCHRLQIANRCELRAVTKLLQGLISRRIVTSLLVHCFVAVLFRIVSAWIRSWNWWWMVASIQVLKGSKCPILKCLGLFLTNNPDYPHHRCHQVWCHGLPEHRLLKVPRSITKIWLSSNSGTFKIMSNCVAWIPSPRALFPAVNSFQRHSHASLRTAKTQNSTSNPSTVYSLVLCRKLCRIATIWQWKFWKVAPS